MPAEEIVDRLLNEDILIPLMFATMTVLIVTVVVIAKTVRSNARERTRREIAAYIAEGSMTPEHGQRLMEAGGKDA